MKVFKFKFDGLLKLREFKEKKIKVELGEILKEIGIIQDKILLANRAIDEAYEAQEKGIKDIMIGRMVQFFPYFIQGKKEDIKNKESLLWALRKKYDLKIVELAQARGEVKVMEKFKENKISEWVKIRNKKELEEIEEVLMMRKNGHTDQVG